MSKTQNRLSILSLILALGMLISHVHLIIQYESIVKENNIHQLHMTAYKNELKKMQERAGYTLDEDQNKDLEVNK